MTSAQPDAPNPLWHQDPVTITRRFYGVFEGGGAKGIAYAGALLAMRERGCWFAAVAGSSAGAITAALVAAGLEPERIATATEGALKTVQSGFWSGIASLRSTGGFFDSNKFRDWLDEVFRKQVGLRLGKEPNAPVTFKELFEATKIELNVVAADISMRRQLILSHLSAPECLVADAVVASCSIPFAFSSRILAVRERVSAGKVFHHTIVDGGVWANFPIFIFQDTAFRRFDNRKEQIDPGKILGFLLREEIREADWPASSPSVDDIGFVRQISDGDFRAREWRPASLDGAGTQRKFWPTLVSWLLLPIAWLGWLHNMSGQQGLDAGRWPLPREHWARRLVSAGDGFLTAIGVPGGGLIPVVLGPILVLAILGIGAWTVCAYLMSGAFREIQSLNWYEVETYFGVMARAAIILMAFSASVLTIVVGFFGVVATMLLLRPARRILYGLITTYVAGPGAPAWYYDREDIIALPISPELTTLQFNIPKDLRERVVEKARITTLNRLDHIVRSERANDIRLAS